MSLCLNPNCPKPENLDNFLFCTTCGSELLLFGRYRITFLLSDKGGFGKTYEVTDKGTPKVLKVLINDLPKAVDLFQQEARVLTQLNHPGIPKGEECFTYVPRDSKTPIHCLVMEKITGLDLEEYIQQRQNRPIDQKLAFEWLVELTQILDEVHKQNFFHRDIKPINIMLRPDGQLALIDFGAVRQVTSTYIAKQVAGGVTSIVSGGYTSPEQMYSQAVPQSDFFSLGRTFVYLLTGKEPTDPEIYDPLHDELRWRKYAPNILPEFADFLDVLMQRSASKRPANTQSILQRLEEIEESFSRPQGTSTFPTNNSYYSQAQLLVAGWGKLPTNNSRTQAHSFTEDLGNGVFLEMVAIPGGTFLMGSPDTEEGGLVNETPQHWVTVKPFYMGKFTVTQQQWKRVAVTLPKVYFDLNPDPSYFKGNNLPVESISWYEAVEFCDRLSIKSGRKYGLPSEAEWEYACRAGTTTPFHFGETITTNLANYDGSFTYGYGSRGIYRQKTTTVGSFPANAFGLYDMHGNVWEWCGDDWHDNYYGAPSDGSVWENDDDDDDNDKVLRGGSHFSTPAKCRCAYRGYYSPEDDSDNIGFRLACF
jgi:formylglycine-generating enzyme required for sulfatase activity/predicted Ser/Thr protein kinase